LRIFIFLFKEKDEEGNEIKQKSATKKKKKEIDLPITPRVPGATKNEIERLIEQEVKSFLFQLNLTEIL
jgi:hypothetical protein